MIMELKALIVDDEERGISVLSQLISKYCTGISVEGTASDIANAEALLKKNKPDVLFLDIEMPGGDCFQLLEKYNDISFDVIFVTAYQEYAIKAIKFSALDYLLKPVKIEDLQAAVEKVKKRKRDGNDNRERYDHFRSVMNEPNPFKKIILSTMEGFYPVRVDEIIYCRADDSYTHFYLVGHKHYVVSKSLKEFEEMFVHLNFFRIHKSYLINLNHIERINKADGVTVVMSSNDELPVSFRKKDEFIGMIRGAANGS